MSETANKYFFCAKKALECAQNQHRIPTNNENIDALQVCYYDGEMLESAPENCINVPIDNFYTYFLTTKNRLPIQIDVSGMNLEEVVINQLVKAFTQLFKKTILERRKRTKELIDEIKLYSPDFSQGLRIFLNASRTTTVMQYVSKGMAKAFEKLGYTVFLSMEENDMQYIPDFVHLANFLAFKPNVTFNVNHFNSIHLPNEIFNFIWFQDIPVILTNEKNINLRRRDFVFYLVDHIRSLLEMKNIEAAYQPFCIDTDIYKIRKDIVREKKIVFVGSSYKYKIEDKEKYAEVLNEIIKIFDENGKVLENDINKIVESFYPITGEKVRFILGCVIRDTLVIRLCQLNTDYEVEIYGWGWEQYDEVKPFYKGILSYGEEISKIYNSSVYAFVPSTHILQQRTLEAAASGAIPVVYDNRFAKLDQGGDFADSVIYFQKIDELKGILSHANEINKNLDLLLIEHTYDMFVKKIIKIIEKKLLK